MLPASHPIHKRCYLLGSLNWDPQASKGYAFY
ncbi:hypothetical protein CYB_0251 [Synechococcus sp. JA-2-3B'a(2-13)]|nr:hypothetical protein CYB_0251 [Synechococcus sp. JA-2-3B'a(2-13)]